MPRLLVVAVLVALLSLAGGAEATVAAEPSPKPDTGLRLNHLQARGTHNSYHRDPGHPVGDAVGWGYSHARLARQLEEQGVRQVELDVHYNWARGDFEVYHAWLGDDRTTCDLLRDCLAEIRGWSDLRRRHHPVMVMIEPKDGGPPRNLALPEDGNPFTRPIGAAEYDLLDEILLDAFDGPTSAGGRVVTPDDVTASGMSVRESVLRDGWPLLRDVRQHVLYVIDNDEHGRDYSGGWTSLEGRAAFVQAGADDPVAGFVRRSGSERPGDKQQRMATLVAEGFMVRDYVGPSGFEDSKRAGAHFISSDEPERLHLSDHPRAPSRCNPVSAPASCRDTDIEHHTPGPPAELDDDPDDGPEQVLDDRVDRLVWGSVESARSLLSP
jgi:hypothetical protein